MANTYYENRAVERMTLSDGSLVESRTGRTIREDYAWTHREIETGRQLRATLRAGPYAWPGGYQMYLLMSDGEALCFQCGRSEIYWITRSIRDRSKDGWRVVACDINWEDDDMYCAHCNERIPSAYGNDEDA